MGNLVSNVIDGLEALSEENHGEKKEENHQKKGEENHQKISTESSDAILSNPGIIGNDEGEPFLLMHPSVRSSLVIDDENHEDKVKKRIVMPPISSFDICLSKTLLHEYSCQKEEEEEDRNGSLRRDAQDHDRIDEPTIAPRKRQVLIPNDLDIKQVMKYVVAATISSSSSDININNWQSLPCVEEFVSSPAGKQHGLAVLEKGDEDQKKKRRRRRNSSTTSVRVRWITHYNSSQKILLVGERDFSFSACLAHAFGSASNMVATSLDSEETLDRRLPSSQDYIFYLRRLGCSVLHEIDVHSMASAHSELVSLKFDCIIFNFPHAGHWRKLHEKDSELIRRHKELLSGFFKSSRKLLREDGQVHVSHRDDYPYNTWGIKNLAKKAGLFLIEKVRFCPENYPYYRNKRGSRIRGRDSFSFGEFPMTFKFSPVKPKQHSRTNKRR